MQAAIVYLATNIINGKTYVGVTRFTPEKRWARHIYTSSTIPKTYFHRAIAKYGPENFKVVPIASVLNITDASAVEQEVIKTFQPGCNQTNGGEFTVGKRVSREVVDRIIVKNTGKKRTPEMNAANSARKKAEYADNPEKLATATTQLAKAREKVDEKKRIAATSGSSRNRVWSDESRKKLSGSCMGRKYPDEVIERMARSKDKPVICTTLNMAFDSVSDAAEFCGLSVSGVSMVCRGERKSANGLHFKFIK